MPRTTIKLRMCKASSDCINNTATFVPDDSSHNIRVMTSEEFTDAIIVTIEDDGGVGGTCDV